MASRIQGITVEFGDDTTELQTALKCLNDQIKSILSQLKGVENLLKLDSGNTELITQKHKLLGKAVSETKEKESLKTAAEQANRSATAVQKMVAFGERVSSIKAYMPVKRVAGQVMIYLVFRGNTYSKEKTGQYIWEPKFTATQL